MFHVPEAARNLTHPELGTSRADGCNGYFELPSCEPGWRLAIIVSDGSGWQHVSVHARTPTGWVRVPTWKEMCFVKRLFWDAEDVVMQLHPKESDYVNRHPAVLHLWRPTNQTIPTPPVALVG